MTFIRSLSTKTGLSSRHIAYSASILLFGLYTLTVLGALFLEPGTSIYYYFTDVLLPVKAAVLVALGMHTALLAKEVTMRKPWDQKSEHLLWSLVGVVAFGYASFFALSVPPLSGYSYWSLYANLNFEVKLGVMIAFAYAFGFVLLSMPKYTTAGAMQIYETGRLPLQQKVSFFRGATQEVIEVGVSLRTLVGYFDQTANVEFKGPIIELLRKGLNFRFLLLDPDSEMGRRYAEDRGEPELIATVRRSIEKLRKLRDELNSNGFKGKFELLAYSHIPSCYVMLVDPTTRGGRLQVSHYLQSVKRADTPVVEIHKAANPILFNTYYQFVRNLADNSKVL